MQASEKLFLQTVGRFIGERFKSWCAPILERVEKIEAALGELATPKQFSEAQLATIRLVAATAFQEGVLSGRLASLDDIDKAVAQIPAGPAGKDGRDGTDGVDGKSVAADVLAGVVADAVDVAVAKSVGSVGVVSCYIDRAGDLYLTNSSGAVLKAGHVVGADADTDAIYEALKAHIETWPKPKDGKDGFSLKNFTTDFDGERRLTLRFEDASGEAQEHTIILAHTLYRGVWREGAFQRGDEVTHEGSQWIALAETDSKPGTLNCGWQLACKRGRDGREGKQGIAGPAGKDGRDGRDLTQLGFDGRKY